MRLSVHGEDDKLNVVNASGHAGDEDTEDEAASREGIRNRYSLYKAMLIMQLIHSEASRIMM
jgi:hypothetical protein